MQFFAIVTFFHICNDGFCVVLHICRNNEKSKSLLWNDKTHLAVFLKEHCAAKHRDGIVDAWWIPVEDGVDHKCPRVNKASLCSADSNGFPASNSWRRFEKGNCGNVIGNFEFKIIKINGKLGEQQILQQFIALLENNVISAAAMPAENEPLEPSPPPIGMSVEISMSMSSRNPSGRRAVSKQQIAILWPADWTTVRSSVGKGDGSRSNVKKDRKNEWMGWKED